MSSQRTLSRPSWLDRSSIALASFLSALGMAVLLSWWFGFDLLVRPYASVAAMSASEGMCVLFAGLFLLALELGWNLAVWLALVPATITALSLAGNVLHFDLHLHDYFAGHQAVADSAGHMSLTFAGCMLLGSVVLAWGALRPGAPSQLFTEAMTGSIAASAGFSTLLGYTAGLPAIYRWGTDTATSPLAASALLVLGLCLLTRAWREASKSERGPPAWSPMPAVIGCLTLTIILWVGLRERERAYVTAKAQTSMDTLVTTLSAELERRASAVERLARRWSDGESSENSWEQDASSQWEESSKNLGGVSVAIVSSALRTVWAYPPAERVASIWFDHTADPVRKTALEAARLSGAAVISGSTNIGTLGQGVVIYSPMIRDGRLAGYVAAEFLYREFFGHVIVDHKLAAEYRVHLKIGNESVYASAVRPEVRGDTTASEKTYQVFNRPLRVTLTPLEQTLQNDRRFLPELALAAGVGITLLLGLSVHLARSARAGQHAAELSNRKLQAENEERSRIEARLKVSDERLRLALDSTQIGIFEWNITAGHVYYSPGLWAMLGYEHGRMPPAVESWQNLIHPDDLPVYRRRVDSQLAGLASFIEPEYRVRARNGEWRWVYTRSKTVAVGPTGAPTRIIGTVQDITARREAEQALRESQAEARKLSLVASKTDNPVLIASPSGAIEWINESFTRVMEYSLEEVVGKVPADFMTGPETDPAIITRIRHAMEQGQGISTDVVNYSKSGRKYHLRLEIQPIRDEMDQLQNFIAIETDITARVETEQTLRRAKAEADDASRSKSEFLASMSHEIRTPMNGVIGMTSLLLETPLNPEQLDFINTIRTSGEALLTVINDILDFSKIESGKLELEHMPFELAVCIEEALDLFALQASAKKLEMIYHIAPEVPSWIVGDITRLRQVIVNLVNNAVKFTPSGSIVIEVVRLSRADLEPRFMLEFTVRDSGIGIPAERRDRLFKAFSQVDSSTTRKYGGTGLGLVISQRLTILMGGGIRVESTEGEGSCFIFTVLAEAAPDVPEVVRPRGLDLLTNAVVLCVEPHPMMQRRIRTLLSPWGARCFFAPTAPAAASLVKTLPASPALLILDGDEQGSRAPFANLSAQIPRLLIVPFGQTAPEVPPDGQTFASIFKPFKTASFLHTVGLLFDSPPAALISSNTASIFSPSLAREFPLDVLLAEDNAVNQKVALRFLERLGYRADTVSNGLEALTTLEARHYHLVLMDLQMPEMDGLEASRQIRRRLSADRQPKIIALTANAMQGDRQRCLDAGMDDYISKPVKLTEIENAIRRLFAKPEGVVTSVLT
ncbi:MAG: response regulator [Opitutus sp.]